MQFTIYKPENVEKDAFVEFWSGQYNKKRFPEEVYSKNIGTLSRAAIEALFKWKNGTPLSRAKAESLENNFISQINVAIGMRPVLNPAEFLDRFPRGGVIWRIFWLHCVDPSFPIYDQHVHRAMISIEEEPTNELGDKTDAGKINSYLMQYLPFHRHFAELDARKVDRALWSFGKFLKAYTF